MKDLLPGLMESPLWEGKDDEFAAYVRDAFGIPASITTVTITRRGPRGRSAVAIGGKDGAIVFVLTTDRQARTLKIAPYVMGPLVGNADVVERAHHSNADEDGSAITALAMRHLPVDVVMDLLLKTAH
jgi:hypothetical protein